MLPGTGRRGRYFTKFADDRWSSLRASDNSTSYMFRDVVYPSASAALEAYIQQYEGNTAGASLQNSQQSDDVDALLSSGPERRPKTRRTIPDRLAPDVSLTLEESRRVLDRINGDDLDVRNGNLDAFSAITDNTDVLLQTKPYMVTNKAVRTHFNQGKPVINGNRTIKSVGAGFRDSDDISDIGLTSRTTNNLNSYVKDKRSISARRTRPGSSAAPLQTTGGGAPSWVQDLALSEVSMLSNSAELKKKNARLYSSQPGMDTLGVRDISTMSKALSLSDLKDTDNYISSYFHSSSKQQQQSLRDQLLSVEKRNRILRRLLYSRNIIGQSTVLKPLEVPSESANSQVPSTPEVLRTTTNRTELSPRTPEVLPAGASGRNVYFDIDVLTSTFQNTPKKLSVDVSSIDSANSNDAQLSSYRRTRTKPKKGSSSLTEEAAKRFVSDVPNEKHKQYLNSLVHDIEESSSSVVTTPWLEVLQRDLGMKVGEAARQRTRAEQEALSAEVEEIIRANTQSNGSVEELLALSPVHVEIDEKKSRESLDTERILDGDRSWEAPVLSLKKPVRVDLTSEAAVNKSGENKSRLVDRFMHECLDDQKQQEKEPGTMTTGSMETLKNMIFSVQAMARAEDDDEENNVTPSETLMEKEQEGGDSSSRLADLEIQKIVQSATTDMATAPSKDSLMRQVPDELKHLLSQSFDAQVGTESLDKAMAHLKNLQSLVQQPAAATTMGKQNL